MNLFLRESLSFVVGCIILILGSPVIFMAGISTLWEAIDRKFQGTPGTGYLFRFAASINKKTQKFNERFVNYKEDAYMINVIIIFALVLPLGFSFCFYYTMNNGFSIYLCILYNLLRIGPFMINFAYAYTLCHKEGHTGEFIYKKPYSYLFKNIFNWYIGLFYGVIPSTFAIGHSKNHHKYNNSEQDVITTADRPRDSFANWVRYMPRFTLYATNVSTVIQFYQEKNYKCCINMILSNIYYFAFIAVCCKVNIFFGIGYVLYPFFENVVLLAAINWSWHAFMDAEDADNEYAYSITLTHGTFNVLEEDFHVVHHQYPGAHWTTYAQLYEKHKKEYVDKNASMFEETHAFEVFGLVAFKQYDVLAKKLVTKEPMTHEQKVDFIKKRVRACSWGPFKNIPDKKVQ